MSEKLNPRTREEMFLAKAAGQNTPDLKPITRVERFLQNLIDHIKSIGSGGGTGGGATPDWNAAEGEPGHVLNRTHWKEIGSGFLLESTRFGPEDIADGSITVENATLFAGEEYEIEWNNTKYTCTSVEMQDGDVSAVLMGNIGAMTGGESTGEPFVIMCQAENINIVPIDGENSWWISIYGKTEIIHELPSKYIHTAVSESENRTKRYIDDKTGASRTFESKIDILEGVSDESGDEDLWYDIQYSKLPASFHLTVLGDEYTFTAYPQLKSTNASYDISFTLFFEKYSAFSLQGLFYSLHIKIAYDNHVYYDLRLLYE